MGFALDGAMDLKGYFWLKETVRQRLKQGLGRRSHGMISKVVRVNNAIHALGSITFKIIFLA